MDGPTDLPGSGNQGVRRNPSHAPLDARCFQTPPDTTHRSKNRWTPMMTECSLANSSNRSKVVLVLPFWSMHIVTQTGVTPCVSVTCPQNQSFLHQTLENEQVWLNPPFRHQNRFVQHYLEQKKLHPQTLSACIVIPDWQNAKRPEFHRMRIIAKYKKGDILFNRPCGNRCEPMAGIPWGVTVYCDPIQTPWDRLHQTRSESDNRLMFQYSGAVSRVLARMLVDTGASGLGYINEAFATKLVYMFPTDLPPPLLWHRLHWQTGHQRHLLVSFVALSRFRVSNRKWTSWSFR